MNRRELERKMAKLLGWDDFNLTTENAIEGLEEYCAKNQLRARLNFGGFQSEKTRRFRGRTWSVGIDSPDGDFQSPHETTTYLNNPSLAGQICLVIIKHAEEK